MTDFKNKKILVVNNVYPPQELGGYGRSIADFANILEDRGHDIKVLTSDASYLAEITEIELNIDRSLMLYGDYKKIPPNVVNNKKEIIEIIKKNDQYIKGIINDFKPDVALIGNIDFLGVHIFNPFLSSDIPIINHLGFDRPLYSLQQKPNHSLYHLSVCSHYVKNKTYSLGFDFDDISVVYPGAYVDDFSQTQEQELDQLKIVFAGIVSPYKGPQVLVEALAILQNEGLDFDCIFAGVIPNPTFVADLEKIVIDHGMQNKVRFIGYQSRNTLIDIYKDRNVFVFPSVWEEPFGISQVEGMAAGLATITSATGGSSEIVEHGISGLRFEKNNPLSLAFYLLSLLADRKKWKMLSEGGVKRAKECFDIYHSVDLLEAKFSELLLRKNQETSYAEEQNKQKQLETENEYQIGDVSYLIIPDWQIEEEKIINELGQVIEKLLNLQSTELITLFIEPTGIELDILESYLSNILLSLMLEGEPSNFDKLTIYPLSLRELKENNLLSNVRGKFLIKYENAQLAAELKNEKLPVIYAIKDILLKIPPDHPLPIYQKKFRLYDKFIAVLAKNLPDEKKLIIDIGANVGDTTAMLLQYCQNPILSIEADGGYFNLMVNNLSNYNKRVSLINAFLGSPKENISLQLVKQGGTARAVKSNDLNKAVCPRYLESIICELNLGESILLKTDTDGFDYEILFSCLDLIANDQPIIYWENEIFKEENLVESNQILDKLSTLNYSHYIVLDNFGNPLYCGDSFTIIKQLNNYLYNNQCSQYNTFYYIDVVAFPECYHHIVSPIYEEYQIFIRSLRDYPFLDNQDLLQ